MLSMTGFGRKVLEGASTRVTVDIRSLNNKFLDVNLRVPQDFRYKEMELRKVLQQQLMRGKVDLSIQVEGAGDQEGHVINSEAVEYYHGELTAINEKLALQQGDLLSVIMGLPNATVPKPAADPEEFWSSIEAAVIESCDQLTQFRLREGAALRKDLEGRIEAIASLREQVIELEPARTKRIKERIIQQIQEASDPERIDQNRLEQEMIYYLEKLDVNEELVRLSSHLSYFREVMASKGNEFGKRLGFVAQEIGREINTIGSKANDAAIQQIVVRMKEELEKIKEQSLNVL